MNELVTNMNMKIKLILIKYLLQSLCYLNIKLIVMKLYLGYWMTALETVTLVNVKCIGRCCDLKMC